MTAENLYKLIQHPQSIQNYDELEQLTTQFPYFSAAQMLYILALYQQSNKDFSDKLKQFSHTISNRKHLFTHLQQTKKLSEKKTTQDNILVQTKSTSVQEKKTQLSDPHSITIQNEINKSIAESIVHKELFEIHPQIKEKLNDIKPDDTQSTQDEVLKKITTSAPIESKSDTIPHEQTFTGTFSAVLKQLTGTLKNQDESSTQDTDKKERIKQQQEIIDRIIAHPPKTTKTASQKFFSAENKARESLLETEDLVSETLAQIYVAQGNIHKAIRAYEILALKFPQKNTYFAAKIQELKNQLKNKQ